MSEFEILRESFRITGTRADPMLAKGHADIHHEWGVGLPASYVEFLATFGPGTIGGFLHIHPAAWLQTHRDRISNLLTDDVDADELLQETGDVLVFADSDNGDMCGWQLAELRTTKEPSVISFAGFDSPRVIAESVSDLVRRVVAGDDVFGIGSLPTTFKSLVIT